MEKKKPRYFGVLLYEKRYCVDGDRTEQKAEVILHVTRGHWQLKEVKFTTCKTPYSRSDWKFLRELATYVEYVCLKAEKDKLEIDTEEVCHGN